MINMQLSNDNSDAICDQLVSPLDDDVSLFQDALEGGDSTNDDDVVIADLLRTPTSKMIKKKVVNLDGIGSSATKEQVTTNGKRSADVDEIQIAASKESKMACMKNGNSKK
ncbi:hypothetical protein P8452_42329 [Trifolium repens]|nr:hypothetical protein P8452_42329 [Trifolium repens]